MQQDLAPVPELAPDPCSLHQPDPGTALYSVVLAHVRSREWAADAALVGRAAYSCRSRVMAAVESPCSGLECPERHEQLEDLGSAGPLRWRERAPEAAEIRSARDSCGVVVVADLRMAFRKVERASAAVAVNGYPIIAQDTLAVNGY